jgi:hypothetical protein
MSIKAELFKKYIRELIKREIDEASVTGNIDGGAGPPKTPHAFGKKKSKKIKKAGHEEGHKKPDVFGFIKVSEAKFHVKTDFGSVLIGAGSKGEAKMIVAKKIKGGVKAIIGVTRVAVSKAKQVDKKLESVVNEGKYHEYRNDESLTAKQKIGQSMREVRTKLDELDKLVKLNVKLKNELGVDPRSYWKRTHNALQKISERLVKLSNKIGQLY